MIFVQINTVRLLSACLGMEGKRKEKRQRNQMPEQKERKTPRVKLRRSQQSWSEIIRAERFQRGDDRRFRESAMRAKPTKAFRKKDFHVNLDPSAPTNQVPQNEPELGPLDHPAAKAIQDDGTLAMASQRNVNPDEVGAATDATKKAGAVVPSPDSDMALVPRATVDPTPVGFSANANPTPPPPLKQAPVNDPREGNHAIPPFSWLNAMYGEKRAFSSLSQEPSHVKMYSGRLWERYIAEYVREMIKKGKAKEGDRWNLPDMTEEDQKFVMGTATTGYRDGAMGLAPPGASAGHWSEERRKIETAEKWRAFLGRNLDLEPPPNLRTKFDSGTLYKPEAHAIPPTSGEGETAITPGTTTPATPGAPAISGTDPNSSAPISGIRQAENDTLRPLYGMTDPMNHVPSTRDQIKSGILFNDFSVVAPGHGLGATNKMFLMQEAHTEKIQFHPPLSVPRSYQGPTDTVLPPPIEWQNEISQPDIQRRQMQKTLADSLAKRAVESAGQGSLNTLGDDYGLLRSSSAKGLPRPPESVFEPIILKPTPMERVRLLAGVQLKDQHFRKLYDAERYPEHFQSNMAQDGGSHYTRQKALRLLPFALGTT